MSDSPPEFEAWSDSEAPSKPQGRSARRTGLLLISGVLGVMMCMLGLMIAFQLGVVQPEIAERQAEATVTREVATAASIEKATSRAQSRWEEAASLAEAQAGVMPLPEWELRVDEDFQTDTSGWYKSFGNSEGFDRFFDAEIRGGKFFMHLSKGNGDAIWANEITKLADLDDGLILIDAERVLGEENAEYGIGFRMSESGYYFFSVSSEGWALERVAFPDERGQTLSEGGDLPDDDSVKHLAVFMNGDEVELYVNGTMVESYSDTDFDETTTHSMALVVRVERFGFSRVSFDNLLIFTP